MLQKVLIAVASLVVLVVAIGLVLPQTAHVERSIVIDAPPDAVFALVNGFSRFNEWSPWATLDADTVYSFEGPGSGVGARMTWSSDNPSVGSGSQEIVHSEPYRTVHTALDFGDQGAASAAFTLEPGEDGTRVTWSLDVDFGWNLFGRYLGVIAFDRLAGADYERGLQRLKDLAERTRTTAD